FVERAFTQELEVLREALTPLSETSFFSEAVVKYLSELTASESFTEFKVAVEVKFPYRDEKENYNYIENPDIDLIWMYGRVLWRQFEITSLFKNIPERQWTIMVVEKHFATALASIPECFWEPNEKRIWQTLEAKPYKKYADGIFKCEATRMVLFILEVSGGPGGAPGSKLRGDREKFMKYFTYLFDKMLALFRWTIAMGFPCGQDKFTVSICNAFI
ncbi:5765_t:CDS:1, partial [Paraglomus occultum]